YFITDDIIRIRISFDRDFTERSYSLVTTAWDDELDGLMKEERQKVNPIDVDVRDNENEIVFKTSKLTIKMNKDPISFSIKDKNRTNIYKNIELIAYEKDYF